MNNNNISNIQIIKKRSGKKPKKIILLNKQNKRHLRALTSKKKKVIKYKSKLGRPTNKSVESIKFEHVFAPEIFSFLDNHDQIISYLNKLSEMARRNIATFIRLDNIEKISSGSIALMLSILDEFEMHDTEVAGSYPRDESIRELLEKSGFFKFVRGHVKNPDNLYSSDEIERKKDYTVDSELTAKLIHKAMETITGQSEKNKNIQSILIEMMANTVNHAYPEEEKSPWWISTNHDKKNGKVSFSFIDKGFGIKNTLELRLADKVTNIFNSDLDMITSAFEGTFGSRTGLKHRGKGLPKIKSVATNGEIGKFLVISNKVIYDFSGKNSKIMKESLSGTFYYFEIERHL